MKTALLKLADDQIEQFDLEQVSDSMWPPIKDCIDRDFGGGKFSFLDLGGGNGVFADRVLRAYPEATGTVLDAAELLISRNTPSPRKVSIVGDATDLREIGKFDIIFCNWLLHHIVSESYARCRANIDMVLAECRKHLTPRGRLSVYENQYNGFIDSAPSRLIFAATSSRILSPIMRSMGANTAGVGVCFLSRAEWTRTLSKQYTVLAHYNDRAWRVSLLRRAAFLISGAQCGHFWLRPQ